MKQPRLEESPIDHHIQADILRKLFVADGALSFNILKPADVQNSLFMYHVKKLESRGLIERVNEGFTLTTAGARWINYVSPEKLKPRLIPRVLIKFLVFSSDHTQILISKRRSAAAEHMNQYLFPSGLQKYGVSIHDSAALLSESLFGTQLDVKDLGIHETIYRYSDDYIHHSLSPTFEAISDVQEFPHDDHYELLWVSCEDVLSGKYDTNLAEILRIHTEGQPLSGKTFDATV